MRKLLLGAAAAAALTAGFMPTAGHADWVCNDRRGREAQTFEFRDDALDWDRSGRGKCRLVGRDKVRRNFDSRTGQYEDERSADRDARRAERDNYRPGYDQRYQDPRYQDPRYAPPPPGYDSRGQGGGLLDRVLR